MATRYCIVQYLPDPSNRESINIGVVAFDDTDQVRLRFLKDWNRVRAFAGRDVPSLQRLESEWKSISPDEILKMAYSWSGTVQLTRPMPAEIDVDKLADVAARQYLVENTAAQQTALI